MDPKSIWVIRGLDKEINSHVMTKEISVEHKKKLLGYKTSQTQDRSVFSTVTLKGHLPKEGAKINGSLGEACG